MSGDLLFILYTRSMNRIALIPLLFFLLLSCSKPKNAYRIDGYASNAEQGETITLSRSPDGVSLEPLSQCAIRNGRFGFQGNIESEGIGYLCSNIPQKRGCTMFFIEKGLLKVYIDSSGCRIAGTPTNDLATIVEDSIEHYIAGMAVVEELCYSASPDSVTLVSLGIEGLCRQEMLVDYLKRTINGNIGNLLGLYLLVTYSEFFTTEELSSLKEKIPPSSIDRSDNPLYDLLTEIMQERQFK